MAHVIDFETFRALRACRHIEATNADILDGLARMRADARRTRENLERAGRRLEDALGNYDTAQARLSLASDHHREVMREVDRIMDSSPVFRDAVSRDTP